jgi:hypothetical protein
VLSPRMPVRQGTAGTFPQILVVLQVKSTLCTLHGYLCAQISFVLSLNSLSFRKSEIRYTLPQLIDIIGSRETLHSPHSLISAKIQLFEALKLSTWPMSGAPLAHCTPKTHNGMLLAL